MKKLFWLMVCGIISVSAAAAYQYGDYLSLNGTWAVNSLGVMQNANLSLDFASPITDWSTLIVENTSINGTVSTTAFDIVGSSVNIGNVAEGDSLRFFLENSRGETAKENLTFWGSGWDSSAGSYEYLHFGANYGQWGSGYTSQQFQVSGAAVPTGQPLPGVLGTMLIGGGICGAGYLRKRKSRRA